MQMRRVLLVILLVALPAFPAVAQDSAACPIGAVPTNAPVVKIGATVSDTGKLSREGTDTHNGYTLWMEWVNEEHGGILIDGVCYRAEIIFYDDQSDAEMVAALTEKLITEDGVQVMLGPYSSGLTQTASVITERENIIMVQGNGASEVLFEQGYQNFFGVLTTGTFYTKSGIELAAKLGAKTAVIAYQAEPFAASVAAGAQQWMAENGIEVLAVESYPPGVTDVTEMFTRFRDLQPDILVGGGHFNDSVLFIQTAKAIDFHPKAFLITVGPSNPAFIEEMGADAEYIWGATQWESSMTWEDPWFGTAADYAARYEGRFGTPPSYQAAESTAAALVLHLAIEAAGSLETEAIRTALHDMEITTFYGPIRFDETGKNTAKPMATVQIQNGEIVVIAPEEVAVAQPVFPAPLWSER
jgi:branched-chain amino acid transport system substrate-binding protein